MSKARKANDKVSEPLEKAYETYIKADEDWDKAWKARC